MTERGGQPSADRPPRVPPAPLLAGPRQRSAEDHVLVDDPWFEQLASASRRDGRPLWWVAVDDLFADRCELAISPWPSLTADGRLTFGGAEEDHAVAALPADELHALVRAARARQYAEVPDAQELIERPLRVGDAFAAVLELAGEAEAPAGGHRAPLSFPWGAEGIADVTAHARVFAKVQVAVAESAPVDMRLLPDVREEG